MNPKSILTTSFVVAFIGFFLITSCKQQELCEGIPYFKWIDECGAKTSPIVDKVCYVNDFGAVANDTSQLVTQAVQQAIDYCAAQGGGRVSFASGNYKMGSVFLKSGVDLHIPADVVIYGSQRIEDYAMIQTRVAGIEMQWPAALITAMDQENVSVSGKGLVNGQGTVFWERYWTMRNDYVKRGLRWIVDYDCCRPRLVLFQNCAHASIRDSRFINAGFWTIHVLYSHHVTIEGVWVDNNNAGKGPSTDGVNIDSSNRVLIQHCDISCNDDNYCLKAGRDADGLRVNIPTEYVVLRHCVSRYGGGIFTCGSETSGGIRNVVAYDLEAVGTRAGVNIKSALTRGGVVENIYIANLRMNNLREPLRVNLNWNPSYSYSKLPENYHPDSVPSHWKALLMELPSAEMGLPKIQNIYLTNVLAENCSLAIACEGVEASTLDRFHFKNVHIIGNRPGRLAWAKDWTLDNVSISGENGERVEIQNVQNVSLYK